MFDPSKRNFISTVVFLDIVGYSKKPVDTQIEIKQHFNRILSDSISHIPQPDRIILDTGDGAALCFLGDPEDALDVATYVLQNITAAGATEPLAYEVCVGINLGPVRVLTDINAQRNIVGDGINVAQRVMSFATANQILASRSFYEVVSCLTEDYNQVFKDLGVHMDKHKREHEVYEVKPGWCPTSVKSETPVPRRDAPKVVSDDFDQEFSSELIKLYTTYVGPMASVLVQAALKKHSDREGLLQALASEIPDPTERAEFVRSASKLFDSPVKSEANSSQVAASNRSSTNKIDQELVKIAELELTYYLGPVAKILVKKIAAEVASAEELIVTLSTHIADEEERQKFIEKGNRGVA